MARHFSVKLKRVRLVKVKGMIWLSLHNRFEYLQCHVMIVSLFRFLFSNNKINARALD